MHTGSVYSNKYLRPLLTSNKKKIKLGRFQNLIWVSSVLKGEKVLAFICILQNFFFAHEYKSKNICSEGLYVLKMPLKVKPYFKEKY